jgi:hypothetical protein
VYTQEKKNEPTSLETTLAYIIWCLVAVAIYSLVLKPNGYTISKGISVIKGKSSKKSKVKKEIIVKQKAKPKSPEVEPLEIKKTPPKPKPVYRSMKKTVLSEEDD